MTRATRADLVVPARSAALWDVFLKEAAEAANEHHHKAIEAAATLWFEHAIIVGETLIAVQDKIPYGDWDQWVQENLDFTRRQANGYMRIAYFKDDLKGMEELPATYSEAITQLRWSPTRTPRNPRLNAEIIDKAKRWRDEGLSYRQIGEAFGVRHDTVVYWLDPDAYKRKRSRVRRAQHKATAAQREARRLTQQKEMRAFGGDISRSYANIRRALDQLGNVDLSDYRDHQDINNAIGHLYRAEDALVAVMRHGRVE